MNERREIGALSDEALMLQVKEGDHKCFEELLHRYEKQLLSFFYRQLGDYEGSKDLLMETFMRIYNAANRYEPRAKFSTYIYRIARNVCINEFRKRETRKAESLDVLSEDTGMEIPADELNAVEIMVQKEQQEMVRRSLDILTEDQRTILILAEYQELPYERIAQIMNCTVGTVKSRMHRARQRIKEWMEDHVM
jgi:RNA polymerase sigma-70 factor, ECF subfamily